MDAESLAGSVHHRALPPLEIDPMDAEARRAAVLERIDEHFARFGLAAEPVASERDLVVQVLPSDRILLPGDGERDEQGERAVRMRIHHPRPGTLLPVHVLLHGGGWVLGTIDELVTVHGARHRARDADVAVVTVEYALAPEQPWPSGLEDVRAAVRALVEHAAELDLDAARLSIEGASAGANLAVAATLSALATQPLGMVLDVPALDLTGSTMLAAMPQLDPADLERLVREYVDATDRAHPLVSPLLAPTLAGLPETWVHAAEHDPLRHDAEAFAARLREAGVGVHLHVWRGAFHDSTILTGTWATARDWMEASIAAIRSIHGAARHDARRA